MQLASVQCLGARRIADTGDDRLVEEGVADGATRSPQPRPCGAGIGVGPERVRPEPAAQAFDSRVVDRRTHSGADNVEIETVDRQSQHVRGEGAHSRGDPPGTAEVNVKRVRRGVHEQVLADRLGPDQASAVEHGRHQGQRRGERACADLRPDAQGEAVRKPMDVRAVTHGERAERCQTGARRGDRRSSLGAVLLAGGWMDAGAEQRDLAVGLEDRQVEVTQVRDAVLTSSGLELVDRESLETQYCLQRNAVA